MSANQSIFARIVAGEIPCQRVYEDEHVLAFLDIHPLAEGHTLVVPKRPVERLGELSPEAAAALGMALVSVAKRVLAVVGAPGLNVLQNDGAVAGQDVPYLHFHLIPRREGDGLGYRWRSQAADADRLAELAARITGAGAGGGK